MKAIVNIHLVLVLCYIILGALIIVGCSDGGDSPDCNCSCPEGGENIGDDDDDSQGDGDYDYDCVVISNFIFDECSFDFYFGGEAVDSLWIGSDHFDFVCKGGYMPEVMDCLWEMIFVEEASCKDVEDDYYICFE